VQVLEVQHLAWLGGRVVAEHQERYPDRMTCRGMATKRRPARRDDIDVLTALFLQTMRESITVARGYWDSEKESEQFRQQLELGGTSVIQHLGKDTGFVSIRVDAGAMVIGTLCVSEEAQGKGIGTAILRQIMAEAAGARLNVEVFVLNANPRARALYTRLGFLEAERLSNHARMRWIAGADEDSR
jgi:ribosomal protein S18 acetylase RimI-like enzyme